MSREIFRDSTNTALPKLNQEKRGYEESRQDGTEIQQIDPNPNQHANDLCPVLSLPTEVSCMIFKIFVASKNLGDLGPELRSFLPEIIVSHVCKRWREISLNYPQLWTRFFFHPNGVEPMDRPIDRLKTYIKRSGTQNLELYFDFLRAGGPWARYEEEADFLEIATKEVRRWKAVTLRYPNVDIEARFPHLVKTAAPNLEYFSYSPRLCLVSLDQMPSLFKGGVPKLRYLLLQSSTLRMPFSGITTLRLEAEHHLHMVMYPWRTFLQILSIPTLQNLSMDGSIFVAPEKNINHPIIVMKSLKYFRYNCQEFVTLLLPFIRAPLLKTLLIRSDDWVAEEEPIYNPFGIPTHSYIFPSLESLILMDCNHSASSVRRVMQMTQNVKSILISHEQGNYNFFVNLQLHGYLNECWPKLTSFTANFVSPDNIDAFSKFLLSRPKDTLTVELFDKTNYHLETALPDDYKKIQEHCALKVLRAEAEGKAATSIMRSSWPAAASCPDYAFNDDVFQIYGRDWWANS